MSEQASGKRVVIVGASSGLGRSLAAGFAKRGDTVALMARRRANLEEAAKESGPNALAIPCDVTDESSTTAAFTEATERMGGIDGLVYATGMGQLRWLRDHDVDMWRHAFDTNVLGAWLVTKAALPALKESNGVAAYFSSVSASVTHPFPGLGSYAVTKAALDKLVEAWRAEEPAVGFTRVIVGECGGGEGDAQTQFATGWDLELAAEIMPIWHAEKLMSGGALHVSELIKMVAAVIDCGATASIHSVTVAARPPLPGAAPHGRAH